jgi:hypothetical protein
MELPRYWFFLAFGAPESGSAYSKENKALIECREPKGKLLQKALTPSLSG